MRNFYLLFCFLFISAISFSQEPFITTWEIAEDNLNLNIVNSSDAVNYSYNYTIDFGDGNVQTNVTGQSIHEYSTSGTYTVTISGNFPKFSIWGWGSIGRLKTIEQWGDIQWESMENAFSGNQNLVVNATDSPDLSQATSLKGMFRSCQNINMPVNDWDVSNIVDMEEMFAFAYSFNQPIDNWDVSNVVNMKKMFASTNLFNQPLNSWNVSNVTNMEGMFLNTNSFNQNLNDWDVSNVTNMKDLFRSSDDFNSNISNWNVSNVTNMNGMFAIATNFNQPIDGWDVSSVTDMTNMFQNAGDFNQPINSWDVSNVTSMYGLFNLATSFNQPLDGWDTSSLVVINNMFLYAYSFNQDLSNWSFTNAMMGFNNFVNEVGFDPINYDLLLLNFYNSGISDVYLSAFGLEYCNQEVRNSLIDDLNWFFTGDSLSNNCNNILGSVLYDFDENGCSTNDYPVTNVFVSINDNIYDYNNFLINGTFNIPVVGDTFEVSLLNISDYFNVSPLTATVNFTSSSTEQVDFCLTANQSVNDLNITLLPLDDARPGFESNYRLVIENVGTQTISNITANLTFDDTKQSFVSSLPSNTSSTANAIEFSISSLNPFQKQEIDIVMQTFTPPTVNGDDVLSFVTTVLPDTSDYTPNDNTYTFDQIVVNSFDPNDKRVLQGDFITTDETDEYLDYIIRFQNTGTGNATFVRIEDVLDTDLDWSTLKITSASHAYQVTVSNGNEVEFKFDNINLPYEAIDEEGSNGFIAYKIKPKSTIQLGDIMSGDASIFFDFNLPIITNIVSTEVVNPLSTDEFNFENLVTVYPNPSNNGFFIKVKNGVNVASCQVYNLQGSKLLDFSNNSEYVDTKSLMSGVYFLTINTDKGNVTEKIIIN